MTTSAAVRPRSAPRASAPAARSGCCSISRARSSGSPARPCRATVAVGDAVTFWRPGTRPAPDHVVVEFDKFAALVTERSQIVIGDGVPRFAVVRIDGADDPRPRRLPRPAGAAQGHQRDLRPPGAARDHREGPRRSRARGGAGRGLHRAVVRALGGRHRAAAQALARPWLARPADRQDREDRGARGAGRDHRASATG